MRQRKNWTMSWVVFVPNVGHVLIEYVNGHLRGAYREYLDEQVRRPS